MTPLVVNKKKSRMKPRYEEQATQQKGLKKFVKKFEE